MAGKHDAVEPTVVLTLPPVYPGSKTDRAYAEGRTGASNPHVSGTPEFVAHANGDTNKLTASFQRQTAIT